MPRAKMLDEETHTLSPTATPRFTARALLILRVASLALSIFFTWMLADTIARDGSPFRSSLLTPWMVTTLWDFYLILTPLLLLILFRHRASPVVGVASVIFLCCLGSAATWLYCFFVFLGLRAGDPVARLLNL